MTVNMNHPILGGTLRFKHNIDLGDLGEAMKAYAKLVLALTGEEPTYEQFTKYLVDSGYAEFVNP